MLDRSTFSELESLLVKSGSNAERTIRMAKALRIVMEMIMTGLLGIKALWDSGFGKSVAALESPTSPEKVSGWTKRWWLTAQAIFNVFAVVFNFPVNKFPSLAIVDAEGNVVFGPDGNPIRPFALYDPAALGELGEMTITEFAPADPESNITVD